VVTDHNSTLPLLYSQNATITDPFLGYQDFVVAPADAAGNSGEVAYTVSFPVNQGGKIATANLGAIYKVNLTGQGVREVTGVFGVVSVVPAGPPAPPTPAQLALEAFIASTFFATWIQDDDDIFEIIYQRDYSPNVTERYVACQDDVLDDTNDGAARMK
jgi:hypothetical protein